MRICIDNGGVLSVITKRCNDSKDNKNTNVSIENSIESLKELKSNNQLVLISFCGIKRAVETNKRFNSLLDYQFFVKKPSYKGKVCFAIQADVMIDDDIGVLDQVIKDSPKTICIWFQGDPNFNDNVPQQQIKLAVKRGIKIVNNWPSVLKNISGLDSKNKDNDTTTLFFDTEKQLSQLLYKL